VILALKELIIVLLISLGVFRLAGPVARLYCPEKGFANRCKAWLALTAVVFLAPNFWIFLFVAAPILIVLGKNDSNPAAAFLFLLFLMPPVSVRVPMVGISFLINLDFPLLMSFCLLTPVAWRLYQDKTKPAVSGLNTLDVLLLAYCLLTAFLFVRPEIARGVLAEVTFTDCLRRAISIFFSLFIPYFVISRTSTNRAAVQDMVASFGIKCALLAAVAIFEGARSWLLYGELLSRWGLSSGGYLARGGDIRAMASTGHPLTLGFVLAVALGFWLYLQEDVPPKTKWAITGVFLFGLLADYSRGPWIGAILAYFAFAALGPRALSKMFKATAGMALLGLAIVVSPLGQKVARVIPYFGGTVDVGNVVYRERLFDRAWQIIMSHPLLGDQQALLKMEDMRQGEGIIDLVNGFITILLSNGFVGLMLYLLFIVTALIKAFRMSTATAKSDPSFSRLGACLVASMLGAMLMTWVGGLVDIMTSALVGLMAAYAAVGRPFRPGLRRPGPGANSLKAAPG
jgi:hypothetical protein